MYKITLAFTVIIVFSIAVFGQQTSPTPPPITDDDVVKISTTLIQLDAVVTDRKGNQVRDLTAADFEVFENGKKQEITYFSYVSVARTKTSEQQDEKTVEDKADSKKGLIVPGTTLKAKDVKRTYAIVVDDLGISFENYPDMKQAIRKFIIEEVQQGDLVAVIRTSGGSGALQSFTSDKRQLLAAVDKIRWNSFGRKGISTFDPIRTSLKEDLEGGVDSQGGSTTPAGIEDENQFEANALNLRQAAFEYGTLSALSYVVQGMAELPGRKSVIFYSEGFAAVKTGGNVQEATGIFDQLRAVAERANRSSVVFYTVDPRGLVNPDMIFAGDDVRKVVPTAAATSLNGKVEARTADFRDSQQTLRFLAYETGGVPYVNNNNMSKGLEQAVEDLSGYYLIAYAPDDETFDGSSNRYNDIKIKVKKDGLKLRTRNGFYAFTDKERDDQPQSAGLQVYRALTSPFASNDISLSLNTLFANDQKEGNFLQSLVFIEGNGLTFNKNDKGIYEANIDVVAMTMSAKDNKREEYSRNYSIKVDQENYDRIQKTGFVYKLNVPVKHSGGYQFRIAVRDAVSGKVGSASQFVAVPNIKKKKLTLSSIVLNRFTGNEWDELKREGPASRKTLEYDNSIDNALRIFEKGDVLQFGYIVYNAKRSADYSLRTRLIREGRVILEGDSSELDKSKASDPTKIETAGAITLGTKLLPGTYALQVIISEANTNKRSKTATQWIEFEIK